MKGRSALPCSSAGWRFWRWRRALAPRRPLSVARGFRWINNIALIAVGTAALRLVFPVLAVVFAGVAQQRGWGLFNLVDSAVLARRRRVVPGARLHHLRAAPAVPCGAAVLAAAHGAPRRPRHRRLDRRALPSDRDRAVDGHQVRARSRCSGAPAARRAAVRDRAQRHLDVQPCQLCACRSASTASLRWIVVTPDMHRVHHSIIRRETDSNFGFNFPVVGPAVRQLPPPARGRPRRHDDRPAPLPAAAPPGPGVDAAAAVHGRRRGRGCTARHRSSQGTGTR